MPSESYTVTKPKVKTVGGFDNAPCHWCERKEPCGCDSVRTGRCACTCGRCQYPFDLPDDGPCYRRYHGR